MVSMSLISGACQRLKLMLGHLTLMYLRSNVFRAGSIIFCFGLLIHVSSSALNMDE